MNGHRAQIASAIHATAIHSPTAFSWFGSPSPPLSRVVKRSLDPQTARGYLLYALQSQLYRDFYTKGVAAPPSNHDAVGFGGRAVAFVQELSQANSGKGCWEPGWTVASIEKDFVVAGKGGLTLRLRREECLISDPAGVHEGVDVKVRLPKELLRASPGFYMALGDEELIETHSSDLVRLYWNMTPDNVVALLRRTTAALNGARLPFRFKVLNDPAGYTRCDAVVLYLPKQHYDDVSPIVAEVHAEFIGDLRPSTPVFTKVLSAGLGLAEDPGNGESFGMHRCHLLAEGIVRAHEQGVRSVPDRLRVVESCMADHGIDIDIPYLNAGSVDRYAFCPRPPPAGTQPRPAEHCSRQLPSRDEIFLKTADEIGQRLARDAVWHQDRCNWLGALPDETLAAHGASIMKYAALGPDLYAGTGGVALFLAELHAITGDHALRRSALGAIRQSVALAHTVPPATRLGHYTGATGIAVAAAIIGTILREDEPLSAARRLVSDLVGEAGQVREFDLLSGKGGAIAALVALATLLDDASLLDVAAALAGELIRDAEKSRAGWSWRSPSGFRNLTGFSHGAAGVGYALLELYRAAGDTSHRAAAEQAFSYERRWFAADLGNWPDFRNGSGRRRSPGPPFFYGTSWCHGAPGIALSRLRAFEILGDHGCRDEAVVALKTTHETTAEGLSGVGANFSLCHGMAGNADVLLEGYRVLGEEWSSDHALAREVAQRGIDGLRAGRRWSCGTGGETPNLMLGLAGIGYFYLRLHDRRIPSVLLLRGERLGNRH